MSEPNKANLRLWVEALRSGKYEQGRGCLRKGDKYCCLGVAADISGTGEWTQVEDSSVYGFGENKLRSLLPHSVQTWLGLEDNNPDLIGKHGDKQLATTLNDADGYTLPEIGDAVERTWLVDTDSASGTGGEGGVK